jgi:hypothetical protein
MRSAPVPGEALVEVLQRRAIRRGVFRSVGVLRAAIERFLVTWNEDAFPFAWLKTPEQILAKAKRQPSYASEQWRPFGEPMILLTTERCGCLLGLTHDRGSRWQQMREGGSGSDTGPRLGIQPGRRRYRRARL